MGSMVNFASLFSFVCLLIFSVAIAFESSNGGHVYYTTQIADLKASLNKSLAARDDDFRNPFECADIGQCLTAALHVGPGQKSQYEDIGSLQWYGTYGWKKIDKPKELYGGITGMSRMMNDHKWDEQNFINIHWEYIQPWIPRGPGKAAHVYDGWFSKIHGAIIMEDVVPPEDPLTPPGLPQNDIPNPLPLCQLSDWMFVVWQDFCGKKDKECIQNLRWVVHIGVTDYSCKNVALLVAGYQAGTSPKWKQYPAWQFNIPYQQPGSEQDPTWQNFKRAYNALLGCPNGFGVAHMLQQRQQDLGRQIIDEIMVFGTDADAAFPGELCLGWRISLPEQ